MWNDSAIQQWNPAVELPHAKIYVVVRMDKSGTTEIFTSALSAFSSAWSSEYGTFSAGINKATNIPYRWNPNVITYYGYTTQGVMGIVQSVRYSISYLSPSAITNQGIYYCYLRNEAGNFVRPTVKSVQSAMEDKVNDIDTHFNVQLVNAVGENSYPIAGYTYMIVRLTAMTDCNAAAELYRYIEWFMNDETAKSGVEDMHFVPLSRNVINMVREKILLKMTCHGESVHEMVEAAKLDEAKVEEGWRTPVYIIAPIFSLIFLAIAGYGIYHQVKLKRALLRGDWKISMDFIKVLQATRSGGSSAWLSVHSSAKTVSVQSHPPSRTATCNTDKDGNFKSADAVTGRFAGELISLRKTDDMYTLKLTTQSYKGFLWLQSRVHHSNLAKFLGVTVVSSTYYIVEEHWNRALNDVIQNDRFNLDTNFKFSMAFDVACGMQYLHSLGIVHGNLSSTSCYIDVKWTVKIMDWFYLHLASVQKLPQQWKRPRYIENDLEQDLDIQAKDKFYSAPELLPIICTEIPTREADTYSFSVLMVEIFSREDPYYELLGTKSPRQIVADIMNAGVRPTIPDDYPTGIRAITVAGFSPSMARRPGFTEIKKVLTTARPTSKGMLDCMMESIEKYMLELEDKVEERTAELAVAMKRMETLLHQMLPPEIAIKLSNGQHVEAQNYGDVTIFFSDIVGFTTISAESNPIEIVNFLNDLYTVFDDLLDRHDVYKVETIGDAYMVSSGLPKENGIAHAGHIATLALELMVAAARFRIRHKPDDDLLLRVGCHTGPVCAGVVGIKMPR